MQATTISYTNMHSFGDLFPSLLRERWAAIYARKSHQPTSQDVPEYDQYDTPASRWIAVHQEGHVLAGVRLTPTVHRVGPYTYMAKDAQDGLLVMPDDTLYDPAPVADDIWEASRVFINRTAATQKHREIYAHLMREMLKAATAQQARRVLAMLPASWPRWTADVPARFTPAGPVSLVDGQRRQYVFVDLKDS